MPAGTGVWVVKMLPALLASLATCEAHAAFAHDAPDPLEREEGRVPLVHVAHGRRQTDGFERVDAADAEHDLLAHAELLVASVERSRDRAVGGVVLLEVRVEKEERDAADLHLPQLRVHGAVRVLHVDDETLARGVQDGDDRHAVPVVDRVALVLASRPC